MKWKPEVILQKKGGYLLTNRVEEQQVTKEDEYIIGEVELGITDDQKLIEKIMEKEQVDEMIARCRLAQLVVDYGEYIEELTGHMIIEE